MISEMLIDLDMCCLKRPFDDQSQPRIRLKSEAGAFMSHTVLDPSELRHRGFDALVDSLGWVNAVRFVQQYEMSRLDDTTERDAILPAWDRKEFARGLERAPCETTPRPQGQRDG
jgi:hypothetical protein